MTSHSGTTTPTPDHRSTGIWDFIPRLLRRRPELLDRSEHDAALLFMDVAGFTQLSERLARMGPEGAELLDAAIARYFDALLEVVDRFGGEPIKIGGDALTLVFLAEPSLHEATLRAVACAQALRDVHTDAARVSSPGGTLRLSHKIGVSAGRLVSGEVGIPRIRREFIFAGRALDEASIAEHYARPGEVWGSPGVVDLLRDADLFEAPQAQGYARLRVGPIDLVLPHRTTLEADHGLSEAQLERLRPLIPETVRTQAAHGTLPYLSRHQSLAVLFAGCPDLRIDRPESVLLLDAHYRQMQQIIDQYGGFLSEFEAGDKGAKLIVLFGAPSMLEDPCGQAARCAKAMQEAARESQLVPDQRIGLAIGRMYAGRIGCRGLVKLSALGDRMNVGARLMSAAQPWSVVAEQAVVERSGSAVRWGAARSLSVKGKSEPLVVRSLLFWRARGMDRRGRALVGRSRELVRCTRRLDALRSGAGALVRIEGDAGIGKTRLLGAIARRARDRGYAVVTMSREGSDGSQPLAAWGSTLLELIGADDATPLVQRQARFGALIDALPDDLRNPATLLAPLIGLSWPVPELLESLSAERALELRQRTIVDCLLAAPHRPRVLLLDNAERVDAPSIAALQQLAPRLHDSGILLFVTHRRQPGEPGTDPLEALRARADVDVVSLTSLPPTATARLGAARLKVRRLDTELGRFLHDHARGNPLVIESWIDYLGDNGHLRVLQGTAYLHRVEQIQALPERLEALILTQLERLPPVAQLTVRVASIIGTSFTPAQVVEVHPEAVTLEEVRHHLHLANQADLLWYDRQNLPHMFFPRPESQAAIHESLSYQLRRSLHARRVERLLEACAHRPDADEVLSLARHYVYLDDLDGRRRHYAAAMAVCAERLEYRGIVRWARALLEVLEEQGRRAERLPVFDRLQGALNRLGETAEREKVIGQWIDEAAALGDLSSRVMALQTRVRASLRGGGRLEAALDALEEATTIARCLPGPEPLIEVLICATSVHGELGAGDRALEAADEAMRCASPDPTRRFTLLINRGFALNQLGRKADAFRDYQEALALVEHSGDAWARALLQGNVGIGLWSMGYPEEGHETLIRSLELKKRIGDRRETGLALMNVGFSCFRLGDGAKARTLIEEALQLFVGLEYLHGELQALGNLADVLCVQGALDEAEATLARAIRGLQQRAVPNLEAEIRIRQGEVSLSQGRLDRAREQFSQALELAAANRIEELRVNALEGLAEARRRMGAPAEGYALIAPVLEALAQDPDLVTFPQRVWLRALWCAQDAGIDAVTGGLADRARGLVARELDRIRNRTIRTRVGRYFPWNAAILALGCAQLEPLRLGLVSRTGVRAVV